jgi:Rieske Fe-S protein
MSHSPDHSDQPRRSFMVQAAAAGTGALAGAVPACIGAAYFLDPLLRSKATADSTTPVGEMGEGFLPITKLESLPADGTPRAFKVIADLQDAWNKFPQTEIGSVYLSRSATGEVSCFNARCPHLGCTVQYKDGDQKYVCPCHDSAFNVDGTRNNEIPPRDLDTLEVKKDDSGTVWVKFQKFRAGTSEKKSV